MFDLSFFEIVVIGVVALIVIGPEKLPSAARSLGRFTGKTQRYIAQIKEEVNREARFDDLKNLQGEIAAGVNKAKAGLEGELNQLQNSVEEIPEALNANPASASTISNEVSDNAPPTAKSVNPRQRKKGSRKNATRK